MSFHRKKKKSLEITLTPMIDVVFLLLIFFMVTTTFNRETELKIKEETKATIRLIPIEESNEEGECIYSGKLSKGRVVFAVAY